MNQSSNEPLIEIYTPEDTDDPGNYSELGRELRFGALSPDQIGEMIANACQRIDVELDGFKDICLEYASAEDDYKLAKAKAYIYAESQMLTYNATDAKGKPIIKIEKKTVPRIEAEVAEAVAQERTRAYIARAAKEAAKAVIDSMRNQLMALQTIARATLIQYQSAGIAAPKLGRAVQQSELYTV
jgi:hypothetical protein